MSMIVDEIRNVILLFSNPAWQNVESIPSTIIKNLTALSTSLSYSSRVLENITVLTSRYAKTTNGVINGFLYVPTLRPDDPCVKDSAGHVPKRAVRRPDLPPTNYFLIALTPWISRECSRSYLDAARRDPINAFIFYKTDNPKDAPPPPDSSEWDLEEGGKWKEQSRFPIYAISGQSGRDMMHNLSLYSGNMTTIPYGPHILDMYAMDPHDYVRVWTELRVSTPSNLPGLWVYFLIVVGVLLVVITLISSLMHLVQSRRRASLARRVRAGEVNLEGMGIKRLTVPMDHIKTFPLFTYHYEPSVGSPPTSPRHGRTRRGSRGTGAIVPTSPTSNRASTFSEKSPSSPTGAFQAATDYQPACEICLRKYQNRVTVIRELPCGHIFHPECIDEFLNEVSSLCPLCKACMLPKGYCPKITNVMVRRERAIRRLRDRVEVEDEDDTSPPGLFRRMMNAIKKTITGRGDSKSTPTLTELRARPRPRPRSIAVEKDATTNPDRNNSGEEDPGSPTDLARRRMLELAGTQPDDGEPHFTRWQRMRTRVFPGF
ncbi:hypothetical protein V8F20_008350 [Naviculisporaceae sp. PSN 640]